MGASELERNNLERPTHTTRCVCTYSSHIEQQQVNCHHERPVSRLRRTAARPAPARRIPRHLYPCLSVTGSDPPHCCLAEARRALFILAEASMPPVRLQTFTERRSRARPRITRRPPWDPLRGPRQCCWRSEHSSPGLRNGARASRTRRGQPSHGRWPLVPSVFH